MRVALEVALQGKSLFPPDLGVALQVRSPIVLMFVLLRLCSY
ncbi:hypothetical protein wTpre_326 [Wolbachia endosymbiont of Trichogramma pretiosum]|nr:hypothetical protein wTpre_326 [Wolbachia endosymbiont of Trichogramma pretiosum]